MSYLEKVIQERDELQERIEKLEVFLDKNPTDPVSPAHRVYMERQLRGMIGYRTGLNHRITEMRRVERIGNDSGEQPEQPEQDGGPEDWAGEAVNRNVDDIEVDGRTVAELEAMRDAEEAGKNRTTAIEKIDSAIDAHKSDDSDDTFTI